jgi:hypothetical protein
MCWRKTLCEQPGCYRKGYLRTIKKTSKEDVICEFELCHLGGPGADGDGLEQVVQMERPFITWFR